MWQVGTDTNWRTPAYGGFYPPRFDVSDRNSVFTSKFWSSRYHFQAWLQLPPTRLLQIYQSPTRLSASYIWQIFFRRTFELTCMDLAITSVQWKVWYHRFDTTTHWIWYGKSLSARPYEVLCLDLAMKDWNTKPRHSCSQCGVFSHVVAGTQILERDGCSRCT